MSLGLFSVPTRIIIVVAPVNALLNYILGMFHPPVVHLFVYSTSQSGVPHKLGSGLLELQSRHSYRITFLLYRTLFTEYFGLIEGHGILTIRNLPGVFG